MNKTTPQNKLTFLYTNIGRGHPFYLDGLMDALIRSGSIGLVRNHDDVFLISKGFSKLGWNLINKLYHYGSGDNKFNSLYNRLRKNNNYNKKSILIKLLGKDIRKKYFNNPHPIIVAHPILVAILKGHKQLYYQHGEMVVPDEALVGGASKVFVPTEAAAQRFIDFGYNKEDVIISGLCIEPPLLKMASDMYQKRYERITTRQPLTAAFFSSGAEPSAHRSKIINSLNFWLQAKQKAIIFLHQEGRLYKELLLHINSINLDHQIIQSTQNMTIDSNLLLVTYRNRREENIFTAKLFPAFDLLVAPSHERTNWSLGLGLPMFILDPPVGSFSPFNRELLLGHKTAIGLSTKEEAVNFYHTVLELRKNGSLTQMMQNGWGERPIDGFEKIADYLNSQFSIN